MLLSYLLLIYPAAAPPAATPKAPGRENRTPPVTPRGGMGGPVFSSVDVVSPGKTSSVKALNASPGDVSERRRRVLGDLGPSPTSPQEGIARDIFQDEVDRKSIYRLYIAVYTRDFDQHMTLCTTIVDESTYAELLTLLQNLGGQKNEHDDWIIPCRMGLKVYHNSETGVVSSTRRSSASRAYETLSFMLYAWIEETERANERQVVSQLLAKIPRSAVQFVNYPFGHIAKTACPRGEARTLVCSHCLVNMSRLSERGVKSMYKARQDTIEALEKFILDMNAYLASNVLTVLDRPMELASIQTIADILNEIRSTFHKREELRQKRLRFTVQFCARAEMAERNKRLIEAHFERSALYRDMTAGPLRAGLLSSTPLDTCMTIPQLWLNALKR